MQITKPLWADILSSIYGESDPYVLFTPFRNLRDGSNYPLERVYMPLSEAVGSSLIQSYLQPGIGMSLHFHVNDIDPENLTESGIKRVNSLYLDFDNLEDLSAITWHLEPSWVIQSSAKGYHVYWLVEGEVDPKVAKLYQAGLCQLYKSQGADNTKDLTKMFRLPGWYNNKPGKNFEVQLISGKGTRYKIEDICQPIKEKRKAIIHKVSNRFESYLINDWIPEVFTEFKTLNKGSRNNELNKLVYLLLSDLGSLIEVETILDVCYEQANLASKPLVESEIKTVVYKFNKPEYSEIPFEKSIFAQNGVNFTTDNLDFYRAIFGGYVNHLKGQKEEVNGKKAKLNPSELYEAVHDFLSCLLRNCGIEDNIGELYCADTDINYDLEQVVTELKKLFFRNDLFEIVSSVCSKNKISKLTNYFRSLPTLTSDQANQKLTELFEILGITSEVDQKKIRKWLVCTANRALNYLYAPSQNPYCLIFQGKQGTGKTAFFEILAGEFIAKYSQARDFTEALYTYHGNLIVEIEEADRYLSKSSHEDMKALITNPSDAFRVKYARSSKKRHRSFSWAGTSNSKALLSDPTGNRRYLIVTLSQEESKPYDLNWLIKNRDMIWASAVALISEESITFNDLDRDLIKQSHEDFETVSYTEELIQSWIDSDLDSIEMFQPARIYSQTEIFHKVLKVQHPTPLQQKELVNVLTKLGFEKVHRYCRVTGKTKRGYTRDGESLDF